MLNRQLLVIFLTLWADQNTVNLAYEANKYSMLSLTSQVDSHAHILSPTRVVTLPAEALGTMPKNSLRRLSWEIGR